METVKSYIAAGLMLMAGLMPGINYSLPMDAKYWHWWVLIAGFMGFYTLFLRVPVIIKFVSVGSFILCFFSAAPSISFTQYIIVSMCCYFYILCLNIKDYSLINKCLQCLLLFHLLFFFLQVFNADSLLNFGAKGRFYDNYGAIQNPFNYGILGQNMQSASFIAILSAALTPFRAINLIAPFITSAICNSAGAFLSVSVGAMTYLFSKVNKKTVIEISAFLFFVFFMWLIISNKFFANINMTSTFSGEGYYGGRLFVWIKSIELSLEHPFVGYGIGTYKGIFPALSGMHSIPWKTAHNCWIQMVFETGFIFSSVLFTYYFYLLFKMGKLIKVKDHRDMAWKCLAGLLIIGTNMIFHFPTRQIQTVFIIIFFLAYCQKVVYEGGTENGSGQSNNCEPCPG